MLATIQLFDVVLALHVMAVVAAFGIMLVGPVAVPYIRATNRAFLPTWHGIQLRIHRFVTTPSMVVILLTGIYLASDRSLWSQTWVTVPMIIVLVLFGIVGAISTPTDRALATLSQHDLRDSGTLSETYERKAALMHRVGTINMLLVVVAIFFMVAKPFAG